MVKVQSSMFQERPQRTQRGFNHKGTKGTKNDRAESKENELQQHKKPDGAVRLRPEMVQMFDWLTSIISSGSCGSG